MTTYQTLDYLPDLTLGERAAAGTLTFRTTSLTAVGWDNEAVVSGQESYAILHDTYRLILTEGASYTILSTSYFDPFLLRVYDQAGNVIVVNDESDDIEPVLLFDGGFYNSDNIFSWKAPYSGIYYVRASWNQGSYYKAYALMIYEDVDTAVAKFQGTAWTDRFNATSRADSIDGGGGVDYVTFAGAKANYTVKRGAVVTTVTDKATGITDSLSNVERLIFSDVRTSLTVEADAPVYRMYKAAFDRVPDLSGLGYQMTQRDNGLTLSGMAKNFISSPEFQRTYGSLNDTQFVTQLYQNVLHRAPDSSGLTYHTDHLSHGASRADILVGFSESPENQVTVSGVIANGIDYIY